MRAARPNLTIKLVNGPLAVLHPVLPGGRVDLIGYLALGALLILVFTTHWFFRYARLGRRIEEGRSTMTQERLSRIV